MVMAVPVMVPVVMVVPVSRCCMLEVRCRDAREDRSNGIRVGVYLGCGSQAFAHSSRGACEMRAVTFW